MTSHGTHVVHRIDWICDASIFYQRTRTSHHQRANISTTHLRVLDTPIRGDCGSDDDLHFAKLRGKQTAPYRKRHSSRKSRSVRMGDSSMHLLVLCKSFVKRTYLWFKRPSTSGKCGFIQPYRISVLYPACAFIDFTK